MNVGFMKRFVAYVVDIFIISFLFSLITMNYSNYELEDYNQELDNIMSDYVNEKISVDEYLDHYESVTYHIAKSSVVTNCVYLVLCIGYFVVFQYLNKGQTIGKKLLHIKIVDKDGMNVRLRDLVIRTCIINEILPSILSSILVFVCSKRIFFVGYSIISAIENVFILVSAVMVIYKSDGRGLHDIMAGTYVSYES